MKVKADEMDKLREEHRVQLDSRHKELTSTLEQFAACVQQRDAWQTHYEELKTRHQSVLEQRDAWRSHYEELQARHEVVVEQRNAWQAHYERLHAEHDATQARHRPSPTPARGSSGTATGRGLQYLAVGTGRDGTVTLANLLTDTFVLNGIAGQGVHEHDSRDFYNRYCGYRETGNTSDLDEIDRLIDTCPHLAICGNGYASILDRFQRRFPDLKLIHLRRRDRARCVQSLVQSQQSFPESHAYYGVDPNDRSMKRIAAFHTGEMSRAEWERLSVQERFSWYYDHTHREIDRHKGLFGSVLEIYTEDLSTPETIAKIAQFVAGPDAVLPEPCKLNSFDLISLRDYTPEQQPYIQWLIGRMNARRIATDPLFLSTHATNQLVTWLCFLLDGTAANFHPSYVCDIPEIETILARFEEMLLHLEFDLSQLKKIAAERTTNSRKPLRHIPARK